jgi:hypothetical protein
VFKVDTQPFLTQLQLANAVSTARKAEQAEIRLDSMHFKVHWASIRLFSTDKLRNLFFLFVQIPFNRTQSRKSILNAICKWGVSKKDRNLTITVGGP